MLHMDSRSCCSHVFKEHELCIHLGRHQIKLHFLTLHRFLYDLSIQPLASKCRSFDTEVLEAKETRQVTNPSYVLR